MKQIDFKIDDSIFHESEKYGTAPGRVVRVGLTGRALKVEFDTTPEGTVWVLASKCRLQDERSLHEKKGIIDLSG